MVPCMWLTVRLQPSQHVRQCPKTQVGRLRGFMEETGREALCRCEVVAGLRHCPKMHGMQTSHLLRCGTSNLFLTKNITGFLMNQNRQFDDVIHGLTYARDSLDGARYDALSL